MCILIKTFDLLMLLRNMMHSDSVTVPCVNSDSGTVPCVYSDSGTVPCVNSDSVTVPCVNSDSGTVPCVNSDSGTVPCVYLPGGLQVSGALHTDGERLDFVLQPEGARLTHHQRRHEGRVQSAGQ